MNDSSQDGRGQSFGDAAAVRQAPLAALWRHKYILIATVLLFVVVTAFVSKVVLEDEFEATATMWVTQTQDTQSFDAVQAGQVLARTYSDVIESENVAALVANELPFETTRGEVKQSISVAALPETQLLEIFPSLEAMEQLLDMGQEEGMKQAVGQIDAILAEEKAGALA